MAEGEATTRKERPYWAPFVVALVMFFALIVIYLNPGLLSLSKYGLDFDTLMNIGYLVIVVMLCLLFIWKITLSTEVETEAAVVYEEPKKTAPETTKVKPGTSEAPPKVRPKRVVRTVKEEAHEEPVEAEEAVEIEAPPEGVVRAEEESEIEIRDLPRMIEYPPKEPGGVYSDALFKVDANLILNLRTLLGKVCHNCEELDDCKRRVEGKLGDDVFLYNFECKDGIKRELQKARKQRQQKRKDEAARVKVEELAAEAKAKGEGSPEPAEGDASEEPEEAGPEDED